MFKLCRNPRHKIMGLTLTKLLSQRFTNKEMHILMVGLDAVGIVDMMTRESCSTTTTHVTPSTTTLSMAELDARRTEVLETPQ